MGREDQGRLDHLERRGALVARAGLVPPANVARGEQAQAGKEAQQVEAGEVVKAVKEVRGGTGETVMISRRASPAITTHLALRRIPAAQDRVATERQEAMPGLREPPEQEALPEPIFTAPLPMEDLVPQAIPVIALDRPRPLPHQNPVTFREHPVALHLITAASTKDSTTKNRNESIPHGLFYRSAQFR